MDFTLDKEENLSGLTIYYSDGRTFSYEKVK